LGVDLSLSKLRIEAIEDDLNEALGKLKSSRLHLDSLMLADDISSDDLSEISGFLTFVNQVCRELTSEVAILRKDLKVKEELKLAEEELEEEDGDY
jgi:hypothetical protein